MPRFWQMIFMAQFSGHQGWPSCWPYFVCSARSCSSPFLLNSFSKIPYSESMPTLASVPRRLRDARFALRLPEIKSPFTKLFWFISRTQSIGPFFTQKRWKSRPKSGLPVRSELPILVIPTIPTSAVLKRAYDDRANSCSKQNVFRGVFTIVAPVLWFFAVDYTFEMQIYSNDDFWVRWGLLLLFGASCISSLCFGYLFIASENHQMLYGGATPVSHSRLPRGFLDNPVDNDDDDDADESETEHGASLELV